MGRNRPTAPDQVRARRAALARLGLLPAALAGVFVAALATGVDFSPERIRSDVAALGPLAPVAFVPLAVALNCVGLPSPALVGAAGMLFGTLLGGAVGHTVVVLAAVSQLLVTRYLARDQARALLPARAHRFDDFLERRGFFAVLYLRMVPGLPFTTLNYAAGLTRIKVWHIGLGTAIGMAPRSFAYAALGGNLGDLDVPEVRYAAAVIVVMAVAGALLAWRQVRRARAPT